MSTGSSGPNWYSLSSSFRGGPNVTASWPRAFVGFVTTLCLIAGGPRPAAQGPARSVRALVGGTLIDGFGGRPIQNSVILIDGERISAVGQVGTLALPAWADVPSTQRMCVLPRFWDL